MPEQSQGHSSRRKIWNIAGPAILANSSAPLIGLVDTWAIGHLPSPVHLAAVGLGSVIFNYLLWAFGFLRMGTTGLVAQAHGAGDVARLHAEILRASALALVFGFVLLGVQETLLYWSLKAMAPPAAVAEITSEYFRIRIWAAPASLLIYSLTGVLFGLGRTRAILALQLVLNISNGILNLVFVIGLDMGVPGVALGTLIAQWLCAILSIRVIVTHTSLPQLLLTARDSGTWVLSRLKKLMMINGFIFVRTIFLMTALAMVMRVAGQLGETEMAASHVINQYMLLMALGLDGFAHAAEALAGKAWGEGSRASFRHWVVHTGIWGVAAAVAYAFLFLVAGNGITALLTDLTSVRQLVAELMPFVIALPLVSIWCYHFDGVFIGATAAAAMMTTMGLAFAVYLILLGTLTERWGLNGLWSAVLVFMALRGIAQAAWYPRLEKKVESQD